MAVSVDQVPVIIAAGAAATGLSMMLWALRISDGARGLARKYKDRAQSLEQKLARADSVFGAHPGVILVWDDDVLEDEGADIPIPEIQGSPAALANLLRYTDDAVSADPAVRIVEGLADLEARDSARRDTTLRQSLRELRENGTPFSLTLSSVDGRFLEADGRTAGARAVVWLTDSTIRHGEISVRNNVIEEARQVIARDPTAFLDMLRKAPFPAWRVSGMGKLQWANPAYLRAVEQDDLERAIDKNAILDAKSAALTKRTINDGDDIDETVHIVIAGQRRAMRVLTFPLSGGAGAMAFDVTEQEEAREELNRHVKAHDDTLNHVTDAVAIFGPDRRLVFHNEAFRKMWDLDEGFLIDGPSHGDVLDRLREHRKLPARTDFATWRAEELAYHLDPGKIHEDKWSLPDNRTLTVTRQRHPLGGLLLLFRDITGQLDLQTKYNALIKTQSATLDSLHEACAVFGGDAQLKLHNRAFERLWDIESDLLNKMPDFEEVVDACLPLFHDRDLWEQIKGHVTDPSPNARQETRGEMRRSDGSTLTYLTHPLPNGNTLIAFADVTATRRVESALRDRAEAFEAADRLKTEFVQNVSYQLRSPLTTILGYAEFLESQRQGDLTARQLDYVRSILSASDHLSKLIENILDLAMIEAGRMDLDLADVHLDQLVSEAVEMVISKAEDTEVSVTADIAEGLGIVRADERRIRQVLFNLVSNALRFTEPGGAVVVAAERAGDMVRLTVKDDGRGIAPEQQAASFDSFTSGDQRGAGLGLALVKHFVELHGGRVGLRSTKGGGTEVVCWLPAHAGGKATNAAPALELSPSA